MKNLLIFLFFSSQLGIAQSKNALEKQQIVNTVGNEYNQGAVQTFNERYEGIKGSPFLTDQWTDGEVQMRNGKVFDDVRIKYDLYRDEITVKRRDGAEVIPDKTTIRQFSLKLDSQSVAPRRFVRFDDRADHRKFPYTHFAEVLYEGKSTLRAIYRRKFIKADYRRAYHANRPYDQFSEPTTTYYFTNAKGQTRPLKPQRKSVLRLLKDKKSQVSKFVDNRQIDFENPDDLVRLIQYYDQQK